MNERDGSYCWAWLIGGSIALAIKAKHPEAHIIGIDVSYHSLEVGKSLGVIDEIGESILIDGPKADLSCFVVR